VQVLGAGGALGGPADTGVNFTGNPSNLGASPHDWGFAKKVLRADCQIMVKIVLQLRRLVRADNVILADHNSDHTMRGNYGRYHIYGPNSNFMA
jgi:hypothetical protein